MYERYPTSRDAGRIDSVRCHSQHSTTLRYLQRAHSQNQLHPSSESLLQRCEGEKQGQAQVSAGSGHRESGRRACVARVRVALGLDAPAVAWGLSHIAQAPAGTPQDPHAP